MHQRLRKSNFLDLCTAGKTNVNNDIINSALSSEVIEETLNSFIDKEPYPAQSKCKEHCNITYSHVRAVVIDPWNVCGDELYVLKFRFNKKVVFTKEVLSYTVYDFLVDIGGSMGLWLGSNQI